MKSFQFKSMPKFNSINAFFIIIGLLLLWGAVTCAQDTLEYLDEVVYSNGTVIDVKTSESRNSDGDYTTIYTPIIEFETVDYEVISFTSNIGFSHSVYSTGDQIPVVYLISTPEKAKINDLSSLWLGTIIFGCLSAVFFALGFIEIVVKVLVTIRDGIRLVAGKILKVKT